MIASPPRRSNNWSGAPAPSARPQSSDAGGACGLSLGPTPRGSGLLEAVARSGAQPGAERDVRRSPSAKPPPIEAAEKLYGAHIALRYEGEALPVDTARAILAMLDDDYSRISAQLGCNSTERIVAIVQNRDSYLRSTGAAEWSGGQYDGRIHIAWTDGAAGRSANAARAGARAGARLSHQHSVGLHALARMAAGGARTETFGRHAPARHPRPVAATRRRARHPPARKSRTGLVQPDQAERGIRL